ncbi:hypothetical protein [Saccharomonospora xinjiangensis]|uniref:Uncharacterized protein n=1 Tax=Saccharomonospora xinjiangensis XJ-54 TaxID=882086 RepID=I0V4E0_9PSEU|nr:hypothetical protein [Saccharomonospora xinjiangensis]EID54993.1 hypothetical protein SacxiDRAFT_2774 [Saccharomonospora xinjiangensis XJ-54]
MIRIILHTRAASWGLAAALASAGLSALIGTAMLRIDIAGTRPERLPLVELCALLSATMLATITRPRLWKWDRVAAGWRGRGVAGAVAAAGITLPTACLFAVLPRLPDGTPWTWVWANTVTLAAVVYLAVPFTGALWAGVVALATWVGCGVVHHLYPAATPYLPTSGYLEARPHWGHAAVLALAAVAAHLATVGATAYRRARDDSS